MLRGTTLPNRNLGRVWTAVQGSTTKMTVMTENPHPPDHDHPPQKFHPSQVQVRTMMARSSSFTYFGVPEAYRRQANENGDGNNGGGGGLSSKERVKRRSSKHGGGGKSKQRQYKKRGSAVTSSFSASSSSSVSSSSSRGNRRRNRGNGKSGNYQKKDIAALYRLESKANDALRNYELRLGFSIDGIGIGFGSSDDSLVKMESIQKKMVEDMHLRSLRLNSNSNSNSNSWSNLAEDTEDSYRYLCIKLRQIVKGWARGTDLYLPPSPPPPKSSPDNNSQQDPFHLHLANTDTAAERAEYYLLKLEHLRKHRSFIIQNALQECQTGDLDHHSLQTDDANSGVWGWALGRFRQSFGTSLPTASQSTNMDTNIDTETEIELKCNAHLSSDYTATLRLYRDVMKSHVYWHYHSHSSHHSSTPPLIHDHDESDVNDIDDDHNNHDDSYDSIPTTPTSTRAHLANHLQSILAQMESNHLAGNPNVGPDRDIYHFVMKQHGHASTLQHAQASEKMLRRMNHDLKSLNSDGTDTIHSSSSLPTRALDIAPNLYSYHSVLTAYRNVAGRATDKHSQKEASLRAEQILEELEGFRKDSSATVDSDSESETVLREVNGPSALTYDLVLSTLNRAGLWAVPDICHRVDSIMERRMGKRAYRKWIGEHDDNDDNLHKQEELVVDATSDSNNDKHERALAAQGCESDLRLHHVLIEIFCRSFKLKHLERAKVLLASMEQQSRAISEFTNKSLSHQQQRRQQQQHHDRVQYYDGERMPSPNDAHEYYPNIHTYNAIIKGLLHSSVIKKRAARRSNNKTNSQLEADASFATGLLDAMVTRAAATTLFPSPSSSSSSSSSMPIKPTFDLILRLWSGSNSKYAGERAEEILSRMEVHAALSFLDGTGPSPGPDKTSYQSAIDCWTCSARNLQPGAAKRAFMLLQRMQSQSLSFPQPTNHNHNDNGNSGLRPTIQTYAAIIATCSKTTLESDKPEALRIAFDAYNAMVDRGDVPTPAVYGQLLSCCALLPESPPEPRMDLSRTVFEAACEHGRVNRRVLVELRKVNLHLHEAYRHKPEHSMHVDRRTGQK